MCKLALLAIFIVVSVSAAPPATPTAEEAKAALIAAGVSTDAAAGIMAIAEKYKSQFEASGGDKDAKKTAFSQFHTETDAYMKTQSSADQAAYTAFVEKKKAEYQARQAAE